MSDNNQKVYVNSIWVEEKTFPDGGSFLKLSIKVDELIEFLQKNKNEKGKVNLTINKKKNPPQDDKSSSHYTVLDTWKPKTQSASPAPAARPATPRPSRQDPEDAPF